MLDHIGFTVTDFKRSTDFYRKSLAPLSIGLLIELTAEQTGGGSHAGFGKDGKAFFWIGETGIPASNVHIAFSAESRRDVDAFYKAAINAGGKDNGAPGLRPYYHENYYGAFILDPDGNNIEAVCHKAE